MGTVWATESLGEAAVRGRIEPGKYAGITVCCDNLPTMPKEKIREGGIVRTVGGGETVSQAK